MAFPPNKPSSDSSLSWNSGLLSDEQMLYWYLLNRIDSVFNIALVGAEDPITHGYVQLSLLEFLLRLKTSFDFDSLPRCADRILFDELGRIAHFAAKSLLSVLKDPNKEIIKVEKMVKPEKFETATSKTIQWLSRRPGYTVVEKLGPKQKILSTVRVFSADTKENREALYLYRNLYYALESRYNDPGSPCKSCQRKDGMPCEKFLREVESLIKVHRLIRGEDFNGVPALKQAIPNNKMMGEQRYKMIYDAVGEIAHYDETIGMRWDNLATRMAHLIYWQAASSFINYEGVKIFDHEGFFVDDGVSFRFTDGAKDIPLKFFASTNSGEPVIVEFAISGTEITIHTTFYEQKGKSFVKAKGSENETLDVKQAITEIAKHFLKGVTDGQQ